MEKYNAMTDEQLVRMYEEGIDHAFDILLERHKNQLFTYILFLTRSQSVADDVFQDTFVRAIMAIRNHRYHDTGSFASWLLRIARNLVLDRLRNAHNNLTTSHELVDDQGEVRGDLFNNAALCEPNIEHRMLVEQSEEDVRMLITHLPPNQQEVIYMRYYQDMPFKEIAEVLGVSINTALGRVRYAILNLRRLAAKRDLYMAV